jgi:hypothetical protein
VGVESAPAVSVGSIPGEPPGYLEEVEGPYKSFGVEDLDQATTDPSLWLWEGFLARGSITLLTSLWKSGKSTLLATLLAQMKEGGQFGGKSLQAGRAVVVCEETRKQWRRRHQTLSFGRHIRWFCRPFGWGRPRPEEWLALVDQILRIHQRQGLDLLAIDPLANIIPGGKENSVDGVLETLMPLQQLTDRGVSVLLEHHPRKGKILAGQAARGSGAMGALVDIVIEMGWYGRPNSKDRRRRLRGFSRHEETPHKWVIEWTGDGRDYVGLGEAPESDPMRGWQEVKAVLEQADKKLTRQGILNRWPKDSPPPGSTNLWNWLDQSFKEGRVLREGAGQKKDPYVFWLPGMEEKWQKDFLESFLTRLDAMPEPATRPARV